MDKEPKIVVYTAQAGGQDGILCFTDIKGFRDPRRAARMCKVLSHRFSTIQECDLIYKIENGVMIMHSPAEEKLN